MQQGCITAALGGRIGCIAAKRMELLHWHEVDKVLMLEPPEGSRVNSTHAGVFIQVEYFHAAPLDVILGAQGCQERVLRNCGGQHNRCLATARDFFTDDTGRDFRSGRTSLVAV